MKKTVVAIPIIARAAILLGTCYSPAAATTTSHQHHHRPRSSNAAAFTTAMTTTTMRFAVRELDHARGYLFFPWTRDGRRQWKRDELEGACCWTFPPRRSGDEGTRRTAARMHAKRKPKRAGRGGVDVEGEVASDTDGDAPNSDPGSRDGGVEPNAAGVHVDYDSTLSDDVDQEPKKAPRKRKAKKSRNKSDDDDGADDAEDLLHWILDTDRAVIRYCPVDEHQDTAIAANGMSVAEWTRKASHRKTRASQRSATSAMTGSADPLAVSTTAAHSVRFVVQGPPRPLVRHRVSTFRMYNPSAKAQKSFQVAVRTLLSNAQVEHMTLVNGSVTVNGVNAPTLPTQPDGSDAEATKQVLFPTQSLAISIVFRMKRPLHHFMAARREEGRLKKSAPPQTFVTRTDVDNLAKFVLDSLNGLLYDDDRQVCSLRATKILDNDGLCLGSTEVGIRVLDDNDLPQLLDASFRAFDGEKTDDA